MTETTKSDAPELWGIDPDQLYPWTPCAGRTKPEGSRPVFRFRPIPYKVWVKLSPIISAFKKEKGEVLRAYFAQLEALKAQGLEQVEFDKANEALWEPVAEKVAEIGDRNFSMEVIDFVLGGCLAGFEVKSSFGKEIKFSGEYERDEIVIRPWKAEAFKSLYDATIYAGSADSFT